MTRLADDELLALHRALVATPSLSGDEAAIADLLAARLAAGGAAVERLGDSLLALAGEGPLVLFDTHLDTVPPAEGWTRAPFAATVEGDRVFGLGAGDAKAAAVAMAAAFLALAGERLGVTLGLALVAEEETTGRGTADVLARLARDRRPIAAAVVGEPTGLDFAVAQKGLLVLELVAHGRAAHAAHARAVGAPNAATLLARDLAALADFDLGPEHPALGAATLEPTVVRAGEARNAVPATATAVLDVRTTPATPPAALVERLRAAVAGELVVVSDRLAPRATPQDAPLLAAARAARPAAREYGSATLSDWALLPAEVPAIKVGPGRSERSHAPDEFVLASEVLEGAAFFEALARRLARELARAGAAA
ncbi:MAG TPA: M20/M25/M40 family metallo-hydrolase [Thermoanaerobaculia bacterium]|jgi:acetylornithine deacetylase